MANLSKSIIELQWQQSCPADPARPSLLTTLPPELRVLILQALLASEAALQKPEVHTLQRIHAGLLGRPPPRQPATLPTAVLAVCKQFHCEGAAILYSENSSYYTTKEITESLSPRIPRAHDSYAHLIRRVIVNIKEFGWSFCDASAMVDAAGEVFDQLAKWPNVQSVVVIMGYFEVTHTLATLEEVGKGEQETVELVKQLKALIAQTNLEAVWEIKDDSLVSVNTQIVRVDHDHLKAKCDELATLAKQVLTETGAM